MSVKYHEFKGLNLPAFEQEILAKWSEKQAFEKSVSLREGDSPCYFKDIKGFGLPLQNHERFSGKT